MKIHRLQREQYLRKPLDTVFGFFAEAGNLERITPDWLQFSLTSSEPVTMEVGARIDYRLHVHRVPIRWTSRIEEWEPGRGFVDRQVRGPYGLWHHRHSFTSRGDGTVVRDEVDYAMPFGRLGEMAHPVFVRRDLERIFDYRHEAVARLLTA